jgi:DNA-binding transcriptional LysR family regulator
MNLRQLEYLVAIAEEGSFTRAAARLHVAQPSLSQQIKTLEAEVGGALLERLPTGVRLTAAGRAFLADAQAATAHADRAMREAREALGLQAGELEIAMVASIAYGVLPPAFERWRTLHPATTLALREYTHSDALADAVRAGVGDVAVGPRLRDWSGPVVTLGWEQYVAVLPSSDPLAGRRTPVALEALADRDWVLFAPELGLSEVVRYACARAGFTPRPAVQTGQVGAAAHLAAAGLGVAILPDNIVPAGLAADVRPLESPVADEFVAFSRGEWTPAAAAFVDVVRELTSERRLPSRPAPSRRGR